ncbi:HEPN-associated N-terminal domain-containing protein [Azonexus hydrophilus]|uniref:HEPN-associated N-terminal domain-containing protein n=1 Tax=Azonexus hydrophilus TaxID=418702 RepID=UPI000428827F|nr:HEPN-associated N-terminal domain-containing protein [Azonexus hydrophilus]
MGQSKREWEEYTERGWSPPDKMVCPDCVEDDFLKDLIWQSASVCQCDYCGTAADNPHAAPVEAIMPAVASALNYFYAEPNQAGVPYDEGLVIDPIYTSDALMGIPFDANDDLFEDVVNAFSNSGWVSAAEGYWMASHRNEEWSWAWQDFVQKVRHQSRYFFMSSTRDTNAPYPYAPLDVLGLVGEMAGQLGLLVSIPERTKLHRVRERVGNSDWPVCGEQLGAPPNHMANAGRMNPAGISYLYLAKTEKGALAEVLRGPPCHAVVGDFDTVRPLTVLDLTRLPPPPSVFDESQRRNREAILFLDDFVADICQPVQKDGREHVSYVPSQVVSEFFAQVFKTTDGEQLDGIVYPSAISPGSVNLALFPRDDSDPFGHAVKFVRGTEVSLDTWGKFSKAIA